MSRGNMQSPNETSMEFITNEIAVDFNMVCMLVEDGVGGNVKRNLIITEE